MTGNTAIPSKEAPVPAETSTIGHYPVSLYNTPSGIRVLHVEVDSPIVSGFFILNTLAGDDMGIPHVLEHMVFLGTDGRVKGYLDRVANRCLAQGTNAWTDTDHTAYTVSTAGADGFLRLLPEYLDHILHPSLTDEGFLTEIHHVAADGTDGGVVYSEMLNVDAYELMTRRMMKVMYGERGIITPYSFETGGTSEGLRQLTPDDVRDFHARQYVPENLTVVVVGAIDPAAVLAALPKTTNSPAKVLPQALHPAPLLESAVESVAFPSEDDDSGSAMRCFHGATDANMVQQTEEIEAWHVLGDYLCEDPDCDLNRLLVDSEDSIASEVSVTIRTFPTSSVTLSVEDVPTDLLDTVPARLDAAIAEVLKAGPDMGRIHKYVHRNQRQRLEFLERAPGGAAANELIDFALFANADLSLYCRDYAATLLAKPAEWWADKLSLLARPSFTVLGRPDTALPARNAQAEKERQEANRQQGTDGERLAAIVDAGIPSPVCPEPRAESINWPKVTVDGSGALTHSAIDTEFVQASVVFDISSMDTATRRWLPLVMEIALESAIVRGGQTVCPADAAALLSAVTVHADLHVGMGGSHFEPGPHPNSVALSFQSVAAQFPEAVEIINQMMSCPRHGTEWLGVGVGRISKSVASTKREPELLMPAALKTRALSKEGVPSSFRAMSVTVQGAFLQAVRARLAEDPDAVVAEFNTIVRRIACSPHTVHITCPRTAVEATRAVVQPLVGETPCMMVPAHKGVAPPTQAVVELPSSESTFVRLCTPSLVQYGFDHPLMPAILLAVEYFTVIEGPLWRDVRGAGLAYGVGINTAPDDGLTTLTLDRCYDGPRALEKCVAVIGSPVDPDTLQDARASLICNMVEREESPAAAASELCIDVLRRLKPGRRSRMVNAVSKVTQAEVEAAIDRFLKPLLDPQNPEITLLAMTASGSGQAVVDGLAKLGYRPEQMTLAEALPLLG
ncbi:Peptidase M16 inactive domain [Carpediemonas membranifera]|uniref:Peptidase M16 inactive domain n=1 Tax=Carpediemonas membranifera TaxID=201153 RepID=A0A8J6ARY6_9EUKA|nr:Peptidase M16 inactive domain [Carpediemonas membranifera]|eukprot:KAG9392851.1 Peptidase M16 inactive domain [Carpediemonas membranifera]